MRALPPATRAALRAPMARPRFFVRSRAPPSASRVLPLRGIHSSSQNPIARNAAFWWPRHSHPSSRHRSYEKVLKPYHGWMTQQVVAALPASRLRATHLSLAGSDCSTLRVIAHRACLSPHHLTATSEAPTFLNRSWHRCARPWDCSVARLCPPAVATFAGRSSGMPCRSARRALTSTRR